MKNFKKDMQRDAAPNDKSGALQSEIVPFTQTEKSGAQGIRILLARKALVILCGLPLLFALIGMLGWFVPMDAVEDLFPKMATMKFNTGLGIALLAIALIVYRDGISSMSRRWWPRLLVGLVVVVAILSSAEHLFEWNTGIDELFVKDTDTDPIESVPGLMSLATAMCLLILSFALMVFGTRWKYRFWIAQLLALVCLFVCLICILGYLFDTKSLNNFAPYSTMSLQTSLSFTSLGIGLLLVRPNKAVTGIIFSEYIGGQYARRFIPMGVASIVVAAWLILIGENRGFYEREFSLVMFSALNIMLVTVFATIGAYSLNRKDIEHEEQHDLNAGYAAIVETTQDAIISQNVDGMVTSWNRAAEKIFGYTAKEMIGKPSGILVPPEKKEEEVRLLEGIRRGEGSPHLETVRLHKKGVSIPVSLATSPIRGTEGELIGCSMILRDITERLRIYHELDNSIRETAEFQEVLDSHAIVAITDGEGKISYVNDKFCELSQYSREELIGQDHRMINSGHHSKEFFEELWNTIQSGLIWHGEIKNKAKDGTFYWVDTTIAPLLGPDGTPKRYMALRSDITVVKNSQAELTRSNKDLEQFAYVASHDLQEPLRAVGGCLQILERRYMDQLDEGASELMKHAVDGSTRMKALIEGLLDFSRVSTKGGDFLPVDLEKSLAVTLKNLQFPIEESGAVITHDTLPTLEVDSSQISQLFQNLIGNALKFTGSETPTVHIGAVRGNGFWTFSVHDNGIGIDPQYFERIFVIFQRLHTRNDFPGTGLGLAICRKIVERHGGSIWVEPGGGEGTTFCFTLPDSDVATKTKES